MNIVDLDAYRYDNHNDDQDDREEVEGEEHCCSGCMNCLGLSWADFI